MNRILILLVIISFLIISYSNVFAGYIPQQGPHTAIKIVQPGPNIALEISKWAGGVVTVAFTVWLTRHLNRKKKKNER